MHEPYEKLHSTHLAEHRLVQPLEHLGVVALLDGRQPIVDDLKLPDRWVAGVWVVLHDIGQPQVGVLEAQHSVCARHCSAHLQYNPMKMIGAC